MDNVKFELTSIINERETMCNEVANIKANIKPELDKIKTINKERSKLDDIIIGILKSKGEKGVSYKSKHYIIKEHNKTVKYKKDEKRENIKHILDKPTNDIENMLNDILNITEGKKETINKLVVKQKKKK